MKVGDRVEHVASGKAGTVVREFMFFTGDIVVQFDELPVERTVRATALKLIPHDPDCDGCEHPSHRFDHDW